MVKFIAEVSSNHNKDIDRIYKFIDVAASAGCSSIKFQLFKIDKLFSNEILNKSKEHRERKKWELPLDFIPKIYERCKEKKIEFACTPFYLDAVSELKPYVNFYKIASYELLWDELLTECAKTGKQVIISTGMATISEIEHAVKVLKSNGCDKPIILHCTSAYPTPHKQSNLKAIETIRNVTKCEVGWSDHTVEPSVINRAIHKWQASVIEFHLDLDGKGDEFKSGHCWLPNQVKKLITNIRKGIDSDGSGVKEPAKSELPDRKWRADPEDGLRPLRSTRLNWNPDK